MLALKMTRGRTAVWSLTVTSLGVVLDITGMELIVTAKVTLGDSDSAAVFKKSSPSNGIAITNAAGGIATLTLAPADTQSLTEKPTQRLRIDIVLVDGVQVYELDSGYLDVLGNVTQTIS